MNAKQMLQAAGFPDTKKGRADFYKQYPTKEAFMMKFGGQATASNFFTFGQEPNYPVAFYAEGGPTGTEDPWLQSRNPMIPANAKQVNAKDLGLRVNPNTKMIYLDQKGYPADSVVANPVDPKLALYYTHGKGVMGPSAPQHMNYANQWNNQNAQYFLDKNQNFYPTYGGDPKFITKKQGGQPCFECGGQHMQSGGQLAPLSNPGMTPMGMNNFSGSQRLNQYRPWSYTNIPTLDTQFTDPMLPADSIPKKTGDLGPMQDIMRSQMLLEFSKPQSLNRVKEVYPPMQDGGQNTSDIDNAVNKNKEDFMRYIQKNVQAAQQKQMMEQMMMGTHMEMPFELPKHQYGPPGEDGVPLIRGTFNPLTQSLGLAGKSDISYTDPNPYDPRQHADQFTIMNSLAPVSGYGPGYVDPNQKPAPQKTPINMNNIIMQGDNAPSVLDGTYSFMTKNAVNPILDSSPANAYGDFVAEANADNAKNAPVIPIAAGDYDVRTGTSSDGIAYEVNDDVQQGELQAGRGRKLNPYNLLLGARVGERIFSADEIANEEDALARNFSINKTAMIRPPGEKGNHVVNTPNGVHLRPNATGAKVDPWGQANRKGQIGNPYYTAQYGGEQEGGEVEMTDAEIMQFLAMGGQLEILE